MRLGNKCLGHTEDKAPSAVNGASRREGGLRPQVCTMGWQASEFASTLSEFNQRLSKHRDHRNEGFDGEGLVWKGIRRGPAPRQPGRARVGRRGAGSGVQEALRQARASWRSARLPLPHPSTPPSLAGAWDEPGGHLVLPTCREVPVFGGF